MPSSASDYNFPGTPYVSQTQLMNALHDTMQSRSVGLFESPTGTGKTLSIICSVSTFIRNERKIDESLNVAAEADDWVEAHAAGRERDEKMRHERDRIERRQARIRRATRAKPIADSINRPRRRPRTSGNTSRRDKEAHLILEDKTGEKPAADNFDDDIVFSDEEENEQKKPKKPPVPREDLPVRPLRILFATRTHTQLAQFVEEFQKTSHGASALHNEDADTDDAVSVVVFGSRKQMCVNDSVKALGDSSAINERCRELKEASSKAAKPVGSKRTLASRVRGCEHHSREAEELIRDKSLVDLQTPSDIEDTARSMGGCPYYAARAAIDSHDADIIAVPYSAILHAPTRSALGLTVDNNTIVVFDEAHNLVDAVCELNSSTLTRNSLILAHRAMERYTERYVSRLSSDNLYCMRQLLIVAAGLQQLCGKIDADGKARVLNPATIIFEANIDHVNLYPLVKFMRESKLMNKLRGFVELVANTEGEYLENNAGKATANKEPKTPVKQSAPKKVRASLATIMKKTEVNGHNGGNTDQARNTVRSATSGLSSFEAFVGSLADCPPYARIAFYPESAPVPGKSSLTSACRLKFFVLDPAALFYEALSDARSVLMLGGTLSPRAAIKERLLRNLTHPVVEFECDHVVPASHVRTAVISSGPLGRALELTHRTRASWDVTDEVGLSIASIAGVAPGGIVVFFTSYDYLEAVTKRWADTGALNRLNRPCFFERRGADGMDAFQKYSRVIRENPEKGALLGAVMGGKLSEGINFSDELGRLVIIVGMPFANATDVETAEVLKNLPTVKEKSRVLVHECLTVVNQCVGRAVRHAKDFAAVVLLDRRYCRKGTQELLPRFVRRNLVAPPNFASAHGEIRQFFVDRKAAIEKEHST